jgi:hypothetical protein
MSGSTATHPKPTRPIQGQPEDAAPLDHRAEHELDTLLVSMRDRAERQATTETKANDRIHQFRQSLVTEYIPVFIELVEKYSRNGLSMQMDASNVLEGGRELKFEFALGEFRSQLHGTVTSEGVAFHEVKYSPDFHGELTAGPMMRIRNLTADGFREFVCERLTHLTRMAMRRR